MPLEIFGLTWLLSSAHAGAEAPAGKQDPFIKAHVACVRQTVSVLASEKLNDAKVARAAAVRCQGQLYFLLSTLKTEGMSAEIERMNKEAENAAALLLVERRARGRSGS